MEAQTGHREHRSQPATPMGTDPVCGVADPIKESTPEAIRALQKEGIHIVMLTGDSQTTAQMGDS